MINSDKALTHKIQPEYPVYIVSNEELSYVE